MRSLRKECAQHFDHDDSVKQAPDLDPGELRAIAARLLSVANAIDSASAVGGKRLSLAAAERVELMFLASAEAEYNARGRRYLFFNKVLFGEPAWDILLDLYIQKLRRRRVCVTSACLASGVPSTTALRCLSTLESDGLVERVPAIHDRRVHYLQLTHSAELALTRWLKHRVPS